MLIPTAATAAPPDGRWYVDETYVKVNGVWRYEQYENKPIEAYHGQLKRRLRPTRELQTDRTAQVVIAGTLRAESATRPQRRRTRHSAAHTTRRLHRTRTSHLTSGGRGLVARSEQIMQQSPLR